jgi:gluconate kinase
MRMKKIIVMGVAGSGKSTLGTALAGVLGCPMVEGDVYHSAENWDKMHRGIALLESPVGEEGVCTISALEPTPEQMERCVRWLHERLTDS